MDYQVILFGHLNIKYRLNVIVNGCYSRPDSAQLSPSLFTDWQELTGNIDPHEFESVLSEYMMSPISSQELNNVMLSLMSPKPVK